MLHISRIFLLFYISSTYSQDISFPSNVQEPLGSENEDTEVVQLFPAASQVPYEPMVGPLIGGGPVGPITDLGLAIHKIERVGGGRQVFVYSPLSIASALYMVLLGARGPTYAEISKILGINYSLRPHDDFSAILRNILNSNDDKNVVRIANGLFLQHDFPVRSDYRDNINNLYQGTLYPLDFRYNSTQARDVINAWISDKTLGKIQEIFKEPPPIETKMVLVNSLYFKGEWKIPFPTDLTKLSDFYPNGRSQPGRLKIPMMATSGTFKYYFDHNLNSEVVGLPYKNENIVFYVVLPKNSNQDKLKNLENQLEVQKLLDNSLYTSNVIVALPKMKLTSEFSLNTPLQELGLRTLFNPETADLSLISPPEIPRQPPNIFENEDRFIFTRMQKINVTEKRKKRQIKGVLPQNSLEGRLPRVAPSSGLHVTQVLHKVVVDINEKGTEAAATTVVSMEKTVSHTIRVDGPFLFFIRHEDTKMVLFWGSVLTPTS